jgi:hypothetical protein
VTNSFLKCMFALAVAAQPFAAAGAVPITDSPGPAAADLAKITSAETVFFNSVEQVGAEQTAILFAQATGSAIPETFRGEAKKLDSLCGKPLTVERTSIVNSGDSYVSRKFVSRHANCLIYWMVDFRRTPNGWGVAYFNFNTDPRLLAAG